MAQISVITPTNSIKWLQQAYQSLKRQTLADWEWVVVLNGKILAKNTKTECYAAVENDQRVVFFPYDGKTNDDGTINVGALKKKACLHVSTPFAVEFDHDDELAVTCLEEVLKAFTETTAVFVFSDAVRVHSNGRPEIYGSAYGWEYTDREFHGSTVEKFPVAVHPLALPQNVTRIWYAPDHVRAWRMAAYNKVGGHNENLKVCDDLELMCKLYHVSFGDFHHIEKVLYRYLIHGDNTWLKNQKLIEELTWQIHDRFIQDFALIFWKMKFGLKCLDLGGGINPPPGWTSVDVHSAEVTANLEEKWPFEDNSVGALRCQDIIEHIHPSKVVHFMNEAYRVLHHGGLMLIEVPSTDGRGAFQDPSHVSFWNSNSFWYYTRKHMRKYIEHLGANCRFQVVRLVNYFPSDFHKEHNILYTKAHLAAIKDGPRMHGVYDI
jgi:predicted SAM-dependent methyltransferase/glycosyltransferase involved in cell wall biosynthesis